MTFSSTASTRKARRKEERAAKKQNKRAKHSFKDSGSSATSTSQKNDTAAVAAPTAKKSNKPVKQLPPARSPGKKAKRTPSLQPPRDIYAHLPSEVAAAMKRDDDEIKALEAKLGFGGNSKANKTKDQKNRLNSEYSKEEAFGENFGSFLDDLDDMVERILAPNAAIDDSDSVDDDGEEEEDDVHTHKDLSTSSSESEKVEQHPSSE